MSFALWNKHFYRSDVGYSSTVEAFKTFAAIPAFMKLISKDTWIIGITLTTHPIALKPPPAIKTTGIHENYASKLLIKIDCCNSYEKLTKYNKFSDFIDENADYCKS